MVDVPNTDRVHAPMRDRLGSETKNEIDATPEMIDAGALELARFSHGYDSLEAGARRIFLAMKRARSKKRPKREA